MPRPRNNTEKLHVWIPANYRQRLQAKADQLGLAKSAYLRGLLFHALDNQPDSELYPKIRATIRKNRTVDLLADFIFVDGRCLSPEGVKAWKAVLSRFFDLPDIDECASRRWQFDRWRCWCRIPIAAASTIAEELAKILETYSIPCQE